MNGYTKLFSSITSSSIWNEGNTTRIVWITMLAMSDANGFVAASIGGLAHQARVSMEECEKALDVLSSPDKDSRCKEFQGRRIAAADGGFVLLNFSKYREKRDKEQRKEYMREYMKAYRIDNTYVNSDVNFCKQSKLSLAGVNPCKPPLANAEAEAEAVNTCQISPSSPNGSDSSYFDDCPLPPFVPAHNNGTNQHGKAEGTDKPVPPVPRHPPKINEDKLIISFNEIQDFWNQSFEGTGVSKIERQSEARKRQLKARMGDDFFKSNWRAAIEKIKESDFLMGREGGSWSANLDWFLKPESVGKIIEGQYSNKAKERKKKEVRNF